MQIDEVGSFYFAFLVYFACVIFELIGRNKLAFQPFFTQLAANFAGLLKLFDKVCQDTIKTIVVTLYFWPILLFMIINVTELVNEDNPIGVNVSSWPVFQE